MTDACTKPGSQRGANITRRGADLGVGRAGAAATPAFVTVAEECRRRRRGEPCIRTYAADMVTVTATYHCVEWCPVLRAQLDRQFEPNPHEVAA